MPTTPEKSSEPPPAESGHGEAVSVKRLAKQLGIDLTPLPRLRLHLGANLARWLLVIILIVLLLIGVFAWATYPSLGETRLMAAQQCSAGGPCDLVEVQQQRTTVWFDDVKDLIQLLVVSLLIPPLAALIGYLFAQRERVPDPG